MKLRTAIDQYILWRQSHGAKYDADKKTLQRFCNTIDQGDCIDVDEVSKEDIFSFLAGKGKLTAYRCRKYSALSGFFVMP